MSRFEIRFNYKKFNGCAWFFCSMTMIVVLILFATSFDNYTHFEESYAAINFIEFCCSTLLQIYVPAAPSISYIILLCSLSKRFAALNSLLRYKCQSLRMEKQRK